MDGAWAIGHLVLASRQPVSSQKTTTSEAEKRKVLMAAPTSSATSSATSTTIAQARPTVAVSAVRLDQATMDAIIAGVTAQIGARLPPAQQHQQEEQQRENRQMGQPQGTGKLSE